MARQTSVIKLKIPSGTTKRDFEEAFEGAAQGPLKEELGSVGSAAAPILARIMAQTNEQLDKEEEEFKGRLTCVVMPGRENVPAPLKDVGDGDLDSFFRDGETPMPIVHPEITGNIWLNVDFYQDPGIKLILSEFEALRRKGEIIAYAEYSHLNPSSIGPGIVGCTTQREGGSGTGPFWPFLEERGLRFDRVIVFTHGEDPGRERKAEGGLVGPNISYRIPPGEVFAQVGPYLKENGELIIISCRQWQRQWDSAGEAAGVRYEITIWPGEGKAGDVSEIIEKILERMNRTSAD
jgi:hypothetical protein